MKTYYGVVWRDITAGPSLFGGLDFEPLTLYKNEKDAIKEFNKVLERIDLSLLYNDDIQNIFHTRKSRHEVTILARYGDGSGRKFYIGVKEYAVEEA